MQALSVKAEPEPEPEPEPIYQHTGEGVCARVLYDYEVNDRVSFAISTI